MKIRLNARDALIVVDVQADFLPGGALAVPGGDRIIAPLNQYIRRFSELGLPVYLTRDWHPATHCSFRDHGGPWPRHCEAGTAGAKFAPSLWLPTDSKFIVSKGTKSEFDAYSGFQDTCLAALLQERGVRRVFVAGLATEYCVKHTGMGALNLGFVVVVLQDAIQGIEQQPGDCGRAMDELLLAGAFAMTAHDSIDTGKPLSDQLSDVVQEL